MARENLKAELRALITTTKKTQSSARKRLAKLYCNEIVFHTEDLTDAVFEHYKKQAMPYLTKESLIKGIFKRGARHFMAVVLKNIASRQQVGAFKTVAVSRFKGGVVVYLTGSALTFESSSWGKIMSAPTSGARDKMEEKINKELKEHNFPLLNAKGFATGHHGGTIGSDPKTTYATGALQNEAEQRRSKTSAPLLTVEMDEFTPGLVASYSDIFWWNMYDVLEEEKHVLFDVTQNTKRPNRSATAPASIKDDRMYRVVYGPTSANIMNPYDRSPRAEFAIGSELKKLLTKALKTTHDQLTDHIKKTTDEVADFSSSPSARTRTRKLAAETVVNALTYKLKNVSGKSEKAKGGTKRAALKQKGTTKRVQKGAKKGNRNAKIKGTSAARQKQRQISSPIGLTALLNQSLAGQVIKNMGPYPRVLENRSGRFAGSAEVTNIAVFPKSVEIQYTYQKDPYAVFEPGSGSSLASPGRDPRQIIGGTLRELAQSIMGTKYGLVRTKRV
jgi:hypothetical protein|tara:strand:+ start:1269 stop:2777 length:1509 start_codon:yes stop_codon:yes gene_type:complete